ncbi:DUF4912 domain-containing protein [Cyanobium sp. NIES-981]|uniref:DUF4912 domain-containing protein n=1 Tax=Cyanobium sp. NIES-981 TaxID=1851505 RepID=UPI001CECE423|nr:DUF4912 domain-containing protein [Cyanobium sp. NIES-981]
MTLRQLRQIASDLGVTLYSRKSKDELVAEISSRKDEPADNLSQAAPSAEVPLDEPPPLKSIEASMPPAPRPTAETSVVFLPRDPQWAYVFWDISEDDRAAAFAAGANQLCLRVADVTGLSGGSAHPHTLQEVVVDSHATEWYLPVPLSDRDYRVELGYRKGSGGGWISLAFSSVARVPALHPSDQILDQFVPFTLESSAPVAVATPAAPPAPPADTGLHERLYQTATSQWRRISRGSEAFHELDTSGLDSSDLNASGLGIWASGRSDSGIGGVAPRQRSFWLVADAELIVYGATDPSAKLSIGGEDVPLSADGTFRVQVPFRDGRQIYPIEAVAADGVQKRSITLEFSRTTPEDNSNPADQAVAEWF